MASKCKCLKQTVYLINIYTENTRFRVTIADEHAKFVHDLSIHTEKKAFTDTNRSSISNRDVNGMK